MKIEKIPPLLCPMCETVTVEKSKNKLKCFRCSKTYDTRNGEIEEFTNLSESKGNDPRKEMGDYIEGSIGVWEMT